MQEFIGDEWTSHSSHFDPLLFGRRVRHFRTLRGLTLDQLAARIGKHAPYLSHLENGRREPNLTLVGALARALGVTQEDLLSSEPPSRRAGLEIAVQKAQRDPAWTELLGLPSLNVSKAIPTHVLEIVVRLYDEFRRGGAVKGETPEGARKANSALRRSMRTADNYFPDIERLAARALSAARYPGLGPVGRRMIDDLARHFGFEVHSVADLPSSTRSITDLQNHRIYIPQRDRVDARLAYTVVVQTIGHFVLGHDDPRSFAEFLRQRVEANYFAGAVLIPESAAVDYLDAAMKEGDLAVSDLEERFNVSHEMAAHRFTNLATHHLGIRTHFVRSDGEGVIWKAYENDGIPFPEDHVAAIEGQLLCRHWGARRAFDSRRRFSTHYQFTETLAGTYWDATTIEATREPSHAITVGCTRRDARYFRGGETSEKATSRCPDGPCCRRPPADMVARWEGRAWPSPRPNSHVLAALPAGSFPGVDLSEVYEFLDRHVLD
jgi:predicted transcriptional regulator/DNA-binding XRE family transcriptional regulator